MNGRRFQITLAGAAGVYALIAFSALALAQKRPQDVVCRKNETQAECHTRLHCKADEELEDCQKRLMQCRADEDLAACTRRVSQANGASARDNDSRGGRDDRDDRGGGRERADRDSGRGDRYERGDRGDRYDRDEDGGRRRRGDSQRGSRRRRGHGSRSFEANKTFGLGLELGEPTGLNGKYFVSESGALDFGVGWIYRHYYYGDGVHLYGDYLWHPVSLASTPSFELPLYIGVGLRYWDFHYCYQRLCDYGGSAIGIRVPVGISFDFNRVPLDFFIQLVPVVDFLSGDYYNRYGDRAHFGIDLSVGLRFWFK